MRRPLPDSEAYFRKRRCERQRRVRRAALIALLLTTLAAIAYLLVGGEIPRWLDILLRGGSSEGAEGAA